MHIFSLLPDDVIREIISYTDCLYWCKREKRYVNKFPAGDTRYNMRFRTPKISENVWGNYLTVSLSKCCYIEKHIIHNDEKIRIKYNCIYSCVDESNGYRRMQVTPYIHP